MSGGINGTTVLLQVRTSTAPDTYVTVGGQRGMSHERERTEIDQSDKADADATFLAGRRSGTFTLEGLVVASDAGRTALIAAFEGATSAARVRRTAVGAEAAKQADVIITGISEDYPDDEESTWTVDLRMTGPWTAVS